MVRCLADKKPKQWDDVLSQAEFAYNSMTNHSTSCYPFSIVHIKMPNHIIDLAISPQARNKPTETLAIDFSSTLHEVKTKLLESAQHYKYQADKKCCYKNFQVGDLVMILLTQRMFC